MNVMNTIKVSDIIIPIEFKNSQPKKKKLEKVRNYIEKYGCIDKPVVLNGNLLIDNYTRYLISLEKGMEEIPYIVAQECKEYKKTNLVLNQKTILLANLKILRKNTLGNSQRTFLLRLEIEF